MTVSRNLILMILLLVMFPAEARRRMRSRSGTMSGTSSSGLHLAKGLRALFGYSE